MYFERIEDIFLTILRNIFVSLSIKLTAFSESAGEGRGLWVPPASGGGQSQGDAGSIRSEH